MSEHGSELYDYFQEYSQEVNDVPKVMSNEIPLLIRVGLYIDNITFHETKEDQEEFFNKPYS